MDNELLVALERLLDNRLGKVCSDYLDTASTCQFLNISKSTLYKLNHRKAIPHYKPDGSKKVYYHRKDLIAYITQNNTLSRDEIEKKSNDFILNRNH